MNGYDGIGARDRRRVAELRQELTRGLQTIEHTAAQRWDGGPGPWLAALEDSTRALAQLGHAHGLAPEPADLSTLRAHAGAAIATSNSLALLDPARSRSYDLVGGLAERLLRTLSGVQR